MSDTQVLATDLAKRNFQVCATDRGGAYVDAPGFPRGSLIGLRKGTVRNSVFGRS